MFLKRITYRLKLIYFTFLIKIGLGRCILKNRYGERILLFHGIDLVGNTKYNSRFISKAYFEALIVFIKTHYNIISIEDYYTKKFKPHTLNIAITFDDGYLNNFKYALPILIKHNIPATFYITTIHDMADVLWPDFIDLISYHTEKNEIIFGKKKYKKNNKNEFTCKGVTLKNDLKKLNYQNIEAIYKLFDEEWKTIKNQALNDYWQLMNDSHIKTIANNNLFTIGAHAKTHTNLTKISLDEAKKEIAFSKQTLENICNQPITQFAFPFGYYNEILVNFMQNLGFEKILFVDFTEKQTAKTNICKNRFVINPYISLKLQIAYLLKGSYT